MNHWKLTAIATSILSASASVWAAKPIKTDDISNMLIQGENRLRVSAPTIEVAWAPEVYRDYAMLIHDDALIGSLKTPTVAQPPVIFPIKSVSGKTAAPWLQAIQEAPILTLSVKAENGGPKVEWVMLVKDSEGKTFFEKRQKGAMPEAIEWNGFGSNGKPLDVGSDYAYSLSIIDEAGNPQRFSGKPFTIQAFHYAQSGRDVIAMTPTMLFADRAANKLSQEGLTALAEVRDMLRSQFNKKIEVVTYDSDDKFALSRSNAIAKQLISLLEYGENRVEAKSAPISGARKGYRHVEIIAK